jgi:hypothetical protein
MKITNKPIHPFLITAYPILALAAGNAQEIAPLQALRSLLLTEIVMLLLVLVLRRIYRSWLKAGILSSILTLLFFSYGHVYAEIEDFTVAGFNIGRHRYLLLLCTFLIVCAVLVLHRKKQQQLQRITNFFNTFGFVALLFPIISLVAFGIRIQDVGASYLSDHETSDLHFVMEGDPLDIYYIILDSYGREDILEDLYGIDNSSFIEALRQRGFYVADQSISNHVATAFSLASSMNMGYIQDLMIDLPPGTYPGPLVDPIQHSIVRAQLESLGYSTVALTSGWTTTTIIDADYFLSPDMLGSESGYKYGEAWLNDFETLLIGTTVLVVPLDYIEREGIRDNLRGLANFSGWEGQRQIVLAAFEHLQSAPSIPGPKFTFAHIISPHRPYLFGPNGERIVQSGPTTLDETGSQLEATEEVSYYYDQMQYINKLTLQTIDSILANSARKPVIILQSDTGPAFDMNWAEPDVINLKTKVAILAAFYFPDGCERSLYPEISPVNEFRILFNCYFGGDYELLADRTYYTDHHSKTGYEFIPVETLLEDNP